MRIQRDLPQFDNKRVMLVVTGRYAAELYLVSNGEINRLDGFQLVWPMYEDNEGFFEQRGRGMTRISGSVRERKEAERVKRFVRELRGRLWRHVQHERPDDLFLFTPKAHEIADALQDRVRKLVAGEIKGDFIRKHPFEILQRLARQRRALQEAEVPSTASSRKLLRRTSIVPQKHLTWAAHK